MKILCVIDSLGSGGAQRQLVNLAIGFKLRGHEVTFLIYHNLTFYKEVLDRHHISLVLIKARNPFMRYLKIRSFIRKGHYDVVQAFLETPSLLCTFSALPFKKWKLVVGERSAHPDIIRSWKKRLFRFFHLFADAVVANSYKNLELVWQANPLLNKKKSYVIYNAVKVEQPDLIHDTMEDMPDVRCLVVAASHQWSKNLNGLLMALEMMDDAVRCKLRVYWYGDFAHYSYQEACQAITDKGVESIVFLKEASADIHRIMAKADGVGLFSFHEGFPNAICEAMSLGKVVLCSHISDIPRLLGENNDLLFDPEDPRSIQRAIEKWLNMSDRDLEHIGFENRLIAEVNFDLDKNVEQYLKLYNDEISS